MADATIAAHRVFPAGTAVTARAKTPANYPPNGIPRVGVAPSGSAAATDASVGSSGVEFTGLTADTKYVASAEVDNVQRHISFRTDPAS